MGLNDSYSQARSQILMMKPLPTVNQAYAMLMGDESQRVVAASVGVLGPPPIVNANTYDSTTLYSAKSNSNPKFRKNYNVQCEFCKMKGHSEENYYKIIGYPYDYKFKKKGRARAHNVKLLKTTRYKVHASSAASQVQGAANAKSSSEGGTTIAFLAYSNPHEWIIDTGATNHMVSDINLLTKTSSTAPTNPKKVLLPNGDVTQDLFSGMVREIGRERDGLYFLQNHGSNKLTAISLASAGIKSSRNNSTIDKYGIIHQKTYAYTPLQNRVAERKHMHILELFTSSTECQLLFLMVCLPFELLYDQEHTLEHLRVLGCLCYAKQVQEIDKILPRAKSIVLMGFSDTQKGYMLLDLATNCFFINSDVSFREDIFPFKESQSSPPPMFLSSDSPSYGEAYISTPYEINSLGQTPSPSTSISLRLEDNNSKKEHSVQPPSASEGVSASLPSVDQNSTVLRRSLRTKQAPIWLKDFVTLPSHKSVPYSIASYISYDGISPKYQCYLAAFSSIVEPTTFEEAVKDSRWVDAMQAEIAALESNHTWDAVPLADDKVPIGCK
ncbi:uncharacterized protein LOC142173476 [Nicotiana tabacum]|uniref:Uncharacterized protein LOC142173476 n=1 Tax=Nicotiana tabacum TaxID=4097 RepID=A0AC58TD69_TOBAC